MKYIKITDGKVVVATVTPISSWIDESANRSFIGEGYIEVQEEISDEDLLRHKYDPSAEEEDIKTTDSFENAGTDGNGRPRWFDESTGVLMQNTYEENGAITGSEEVS